jgi:hypothetical protein
VEIGALVGVAGSGEGSGGSVAVSVGVGAGGVALAGGLQPTSSTASKSEIRPIDLRMEGLLGSGRVVYFIDHTPKTGKAE